MTIVQMHNITINSDCVDSANPFEVCKRNRELKKEITLDKNVTAFRKFKSFVLIVSYQHRSNIKNHQNDYKVNTAR